MEQFGELNEQRQQEWEALVAQQRLELSDSVRETLADATSLEDDEVDQVDGLGGSIAVSPVDGQAETLIAPRLTLHSKPMPVVQRETLMQESSFSLFAADSSPTEPRLAGRLLKVRLEAVHSSQEVQPPLNASRPLEKVSTRPLNAVRSQNGSAAKLRSGLSGSAMFDRGQRAMTIMNTHITLSSVVVVTLTEDPGRVGVRYVSLQPGLGFTVHLSAPAERTTPFNYAILAG